MSFKYTSISVVICSKINTFIFRLYFRYTEVLILKVYHKKVLLIPPNPILNTHKQICYPMHTTEIPILTLHMGNSVPHISSFMNKVYIIHRLCNVLCHIDVVIKNN